LVLVGI